MNERVTKPEMTAKGEESRLVIQGQTRACMFVKEAGHGPTCGLWGNSTWDRHPGTVAGLVVWWRTPET